MRWSRRQNRKVRGRVLAAHQPVLGRLLLPVRPEAAGNGEGLSIEPYPFSDLGRQVGIFEDFALFR